MTRGRDGELITEHEPDAPHRCYAGWLSAPDADEARPCTTCRPWLRTRRPPTSHELDAARAGRMTHPGIGGAS